jgi:hypothetical protein
VSICPYCGIRGERHNFLSSAQRQYVKLYCEKLEVALSAAEDGAHVIDMDAVADAAGKDVEKPPFYYAEQSQQKQFNCSACGEFNDILGALPTARSVAHVITLANLKMLSYPRSGRV